MHEKCIETPFYKCIAILNGLTYDFDRSLVLRVGILEEGVWGSHQNDSFIKIIITTPQLLVMHPIYFNAYLVKDGIYCYGWKMDRNFSPEV